MSGRTGHFYDRIRAEAERLGWVFDRKSNGHDIFRRKGKTTPLPRKLDDPRVFHEIRRRLHGVEP